jgi:hypothetical protein
LAQLYKWLQISVLPAYLNYKTAKKPLTLYMEISSIRDYFPEAKGFVNKKSPP